MASRNVETIRVAHENWNKRDFESLTSTLAENFTYVDHARGGKISGRKAFREFVEAWAKAFPDGTIINPQYLDAGDTVIAQFTVEGTNNGPFLGLQPTGRRVTVTFCEIVRCDSVLLEERRQRHQVELRRDDELQAVERPTERADVPFELLERRGRVARHACRLQSRDEERPASHYVGCYSGEGDPREGVRAVAGLADHADVRRPAERQAQPFADDLVVVDAPSSGHGLAMLTTPRTFGEIARVGPIRRQATKVSDMLSDPARTGYVAVALPEEMPVNEGLPG